MEIKCIITDDEPVARKGIRSYIEKIGFLSLVAECENVMQLNDKIKTTSPDLLLLDIEMPDMTGMAFLSTLVNPPKVIIISAYEQYALQGYELNVTDYLLKPVSFARFLKSVNKVHDLMATEKKHEDDYLFVKCEHKLKKLFLKDIVYVASMENYVVIHTATSKNIVYNTLRQIQDNLPAHLFIQTHRSYLVNLAFVKSIDGNELDLGAVKVPIARNLKDDVFNTIINRRLVVKK